MALSVPIAMLPLDLGYHSGPYVLAQRDLGAMSSAGLDRNGSRMDTTGKIEPSLRHCDACVGLAPQSEVGPTWTGLGPNAVVGFPGGSILSTDHQCLPLVFGEVLLGRGHAADR